MNLNYLESRSFYIIKEADKRFNKIGVLWSMGKDSTAVLYLIRKLFEGEIPYDVINIDNGIDFPESYRFRDLIKDMWNIKLVIAKSKIKKEISGFACCGSNKTEALKEILKKNRYDALIVSIRRDEHGIRAKESYFSKRDASMRWNYKEPRLELFGNFIVDNLKEGHYRVHPLLDWSELDVWRYIKREKIPVNPLYFSKDGYRYRSLGCTHCTVPVRSDADSIDKIIYELKHTKTEERGGRDQDKEKEYIMQRLRAMGYM
ncbi:MAG: sulfate adenylyltransferase subunit 2 [Candidatus Micrarchaeota archaeon]|nr:MAG: sulfate adenylyltransferase subunit 2 [Candidatus Micrarchaeota archaeon]